MDNENSFTSLLEDSFSDDNKSIKDCSTNLKEALKSLTERYDTEPLQQVLQELHPKDLLDEKSFSETLPFVHQLLAESLKQIDTTISADANGDKVRDVKRQLLMCHELLSVWEKSMELASKFNETSATDLKCILEYSLLAITLIFEHCKVSKKLYGTLFENVSEELTNLFRKAKTILNLFLATLDGVIVFDTDTESETELLVKAIDKIGLLVTIAHILDLKTFVEVLRIFCKLTITHERSVKRTEVSSVISHLTQLTIDVSSMLLFCQDTSDQIDERKIRVIGHSLKILNKLFEAYCSHTNNEILRCVIELLLKMHRCSPLCLQQSQIDDKLIELINVHIWRGSEPFLNTIFKSHDFKQTYFEYGDQENTDKLGYHLLTISIMKKLIGMPYEDNRKWIVGAESILDVALSNINYLQEEICVGQVRLPGVQDIGERPRSATLYEATLVPICGLISQVPADEFHAVELILLRHLLSSKLWSSLLTSDVWCFIGRIGSSELCAAHVKYLLQVYAALMKRNNSFEVVMLGNLIGRLYSLLSEETKHSLITELDDLENPSWIPLARFFPSKTRLFVQNQLARALNEIPYSFAELQRQPTAQNWNRVTTLILLIGKLNYAIEKSMIDVLLQMWNSVSDTIEIFEGRQLDILSEFMSKLFNATQPEKIKDDTFSSILEAVLMSFLCFSSHVKVVASHYLRNNVDCFGSCGTKTANTLAELNCHLLEDENPWVRQEALESFDHVAHMCPNEDLVTKMAAAVTRKPLLNDSLPAYLSSTVYYKFHDFSNIRAYLQHVAKNSSNFDHVCNNYEDSQRDEKLAKLETQSVESLNENLPWSDLDEHVNKICDELNDILKKSDNISNYVLQRLQLTCANILDLTKSK